MPPLTIYRVVLDEAAYRSCGQETDGYPIESGVSLDLSSQVQ